MVLGSHKGTWCSRHSRARGAVCFPVMPIRTQWLEGEQVLDWAHMASDCRAGLLWQPWAALKLSISQAFLPRCLPERVLPKTPGQLWPWVKIPSSGPPHFLLSCRKLRALPEGRLVVQRLCPLQPQWGLVPWGPLPQPLPGRSLLGRVPRRLLLAQEGCHDDPAQPQHLPLVQLPPERPAARQLPTAGSSRGWEDSGGRLLFPESRRQMMELNRYSGSLSLLLTCTPHSPLMPRTGWGSMALSSNRLSPYKQDPSAKRPTTHPPPYTHVDEPHGALTCGP